VRTHVLTFFFSLTLISMIASTSFAQPPMTSDGASTGMGEWLAPLNPANWTMPQMPWAGEPARIKKKSGNAFSTANQSAKEGWSKTTGAAKQGWSKTTGTAKDGWSKTKNALNPARLFNADSPGDTPTQPMSNQSQTGVFGNMFKPQEKDEGVRTVNDFLSQPQPR